jgi:hypothetical protein
MPKALLPEGLTERPGKLPMTLKPLEPTKNHAGEAPRSCTAPAQRQICSGAR